MRALETPSPADSAFHISDDCWMIFFPNPADERKT